MQVIDYQYVTHVQFFFAKNSKQIFFIKIFFELLFSPKQDNDFSPKKMTKSHLSK